jgi:hypothetical protein
VKKKASITSLRREIPFNVVEKVENEVIYNPQQAIYQISFKNTSMLNSKVYKFVICRKPTKPEFNDFDVSVQMITTYDTIYVEDIEYI